jgi:hypothetical protein
MHAHEEKTNKTPNVSVKENHPYNHGSQLTQIERRLSSSVAVLMI